MNEVKNLISDFRGGAPSKCDWCQKICNYEEIHPISGGEWVCLECFEEANNFLDEGGPEIYDEPKEFDPYELKSHEMEALRIISHIIGLGQSVKIAALNEYNQEILAWTIKEKKK